MVITRILKTLSDGELIVIAEQLTNEKLDEKLLFKQIVSKGNEGETINEMYDEVNSDNFRGTLPRLIALELANRYREHISTPHF